MVDGSTGVVVEHQGGQVKLADMAARSEGNPNWPVVLRHPRYGEGKAHDQQVRAFLHGDLLLEAAVQSRGVGELEMPMSIECEKGKYFPWCRLFQGIRLSGMGDASGRRGTVSTVGFSL
jgi:hypothetical protein